MCNYVKHYKIIYNYSGVCVCVCVCVARVSGYNPDEVNFVRSFLQVAGSPILFKAKGCCFVISLTNIKPLQLYKTCIQHTE